MPDQTTTGSNDDLKKDLSNLHREMKVQIAKLNSSMIYARHELTLVAAYAELLPPATTNRAAIIGRINNALTELGGPIEKKSR